MRKVGIFVLLITALITGIIFVGVKPGSLKKVDVADQVSVIVSPFGSKNILGIWQGETAPFMNTIEKESDVSAMIPLCDKGYMGYIYTGNQCWL